MSDLNTYNIYALSERAAVIDLGNTITETLNNKILALHDWLRQHPFQGLKDMVPAYSSLTVLYDPYVVHRQFRGATAFEFVRQQLHEAWAAAGSNEQVAAKKLSIPVCYDPAFAPDLALVAAAKNMSTADVIGLHCGLEYRVYMLGFLPGFAYMGRLPERLVMPRRQVPRENVAAGSVGIASWQTGIYPLDSPGGWQIIGRTPVKLFNAQDNPPALLAAGDRVQFYPITMQEFEAWQTNNNYVAQHS